MRTFKNKLEWANSIMPLLKFCQDEAPSKSLALITTEVTNRDGYSHAKKHHFPCQALNH